MKKKEADGLHPASHYLVVENADEVSTWHLRVRNMMGELDHRLMGAAWAALHDGYRGNKYEGPGKEKALAELKRLYDKEGMEEPGEEDHADHMDKAASSIAKFDSEWVWAGISHNAYIDRGRDILPLALLQKDIDRQTKWIEDGLFKDYGGLWENHDENKVLGRIKFRAIVPGTRIALEAGTIQPHHAKKFIGSEWPMSIGYWFTADKEGSYTEFVKYESSPLTEKRPMNVLTWFKVYQREAATSDALTKFSKEK